MSVSYYVFGKVDDKEVRVYKISNKYGNYIEVINYGAIIKNICIKDKNNNLVDVVLGYDDLKGYMENPCFFGATIAPNANRIENGRFTVNGKEINVIKNENGITSLHSGPKGFEKQIFDIEEVGNDFVRFSYTSDNNYNGFPGKFTLNVTFAFDDDNNLKIDYNGKCTEDTIANCTNHSYFNLNGNSGKDVNNIKLKLNSSYFVPVRDQKAIPTGEYENVEGTPFDFRIEKEIGKDINSDYNQTVYGKGYDHSLVIDCFKENKLNYLGYAKSDDTGIKMEIYTTCPCFQLYTGNYINNIKGKKDFIYNERQGFCVETGAEPNAINEEKFYNTVLLKNEKYSSKTIYKFIV